MTWKYEQPWIAVLDALARDDQEKEHSGPNDEGMEKARVDVGGAAGPVVVTKGMEKGR